MKTVKRSIAILLGASLSACTVEKKETVPDTATTTIVVPPAPAATVTPSPKAAPSKTPAKSKTKTSTAGGERDSAFQPILTIGADGKVRPAKK